jgi:expansin (peptidoglycan-binding protein)
MSSSDSDSDSSQTQTSTTQDNRISAASGSVNFSQASGNTVTSDDHSQTTTVYQSLDAGVVGDSYDFASKISSGAASTAAASVGAMKETTKNALAAVSDAYAGSMAGTIDISKNAMGRIQDMAESSNASVSSAWKGAVGAIADNSKASVSAVSSANAAALSQVSKAYDGVTGALKDAWQESKAGEQKLLAYGVMAAVAVVALGALRKA